VIETLTDEQEYKPIIHLSMKRLILFQLLLTFIFIAGFGQRKIVNVPDIPGYVTLKCDFHLHTVFSDGSVWPVNRVTEAYRDGLDAISITDHIEYTPNRNYIPVDHNAAWKICQGAAAERNLILVHGAELTRSMPPGHLNALFITDATALVRDSVSDAIEEALKQGAFIQWNHPGWKAQEADGIPKLYPIHKRFLEKKWIHGIEFFNSDEYYPLVLTFCKDHNIAVMANSDKHGNISEDYREPEYPNRPMTLVFAKARTPEALKEALFAGRTLAYFRNIVAGKEEFARPFFQQCIRTAKPYYQNDRSIFFEITNSSDITFSLVNGPAEAPSSITLPANSVTRVTLARKFTGPLVYDVSNVMTGENSVLRTEITYR